MTNTPKFSDASTAAMIGYGRYSYRTGRTLPQTLADARNSGASCEGIEDAKCGWVAERNEMAER